MALNYIENFRVFASAVSGCVSISSFASLVGISVVIASYLGLNIFAITARVKEHKLIIKKKKHDHIVFLAKTKLNTITKF